MYSNPKSGERRAEIQRRTPTEGKKKFWTKTERASSYLFVKYPKSNKQPKNVGTTVIAMDERRHRINSLWDRKLKDHAMQWMAPNITPATIVIPSAVNASTEVGFPE
jgi:hypothetical protein